MGAPPPRLRLRLVDELDRVQPDRRDAADETGEVGHGPPGRGFRRDGARRRRARDQRLRLSGSRSLPASLRGVSALWHPFAAMGKVEGHELVLVRGEGSTVYAND